MTMTVDASSALAKLQGWSVNVFDSSGKLFQSFSGKWPDNKVTWDGKGMSGDFVMPSSSYSAVATVSDEYGLEGTLRASIAVEASAMASAPPAPQVIAPVPVPAGNDAVQASLAGFSPKSESSNREIKLWLTFGEPTAVKSWRLALESSQGVVQRTFVGDGKEPSRVPDSGTAKTIPGRTLLMGPTRRSSPWTTAAGSLHS